MNPWTGTMHILATKRAVGTDGSDRKSEGQSTASSDASRKQNGLKVLRWWAHQDSNLGPDYEGVP
jgi:hypothetical protein